MMIGNGAFVFTLYLIYDTQIMMGGKHEYALDPEEYILMIVVGSRSD